MNNRGSRRSLMDKLNDDLNQDSFSENTNPSMGDTINHDVVPPQNGRTSLKEKFNENTNNDFNTNSNYNNKNDNYTNMHSNHNDEDILTKDNVAQKIESFSEKNKVLKFLRKNKVFDAFWRAFFSSNHIESKPLRYMDRFLKVSFLGLAAGAFVVAVLILTSPNQFTKELIYRKNDTIVYDVKNKPMGKISHKRENGENIQNVEYKDFNQGIVNSVVGTEDKTFFKHGGFDAVSTVESGVSTVILRRSKAGGSTITQQIIGETHIGRLNNSSIPRKIREIFLSSIGEVELTKEQIMQSYLNYFEFGQNNIRGVELASKYFFNSKTSELDYVQSSILAGTLNMPTFTNPLGGQGTDGYYNNSQPRLENVLLANKNQGYLSSQEYFLLQQIKVKNEVDFNKKTNSNPYQAYIDIVAKEIVEKYDVDPFVKTLKIFTTMDTDAQKHANKIIKAKDPNVPQPPNKYLDLGFMVTKTQTGEIVAVGGGKGYRKAGAYLNSNATENPHQPGSAFKPIIDYSPTFEFLQWGDRAPISNEAYRYPAEYGGDVVNNFDSDRGGTGGIMTMDAAIANSRNLTALRAMEAVYTKPGVGLPKLTEYLNKLGFDFNNTEVMPSYGLGGLENGTTPEKMNGAYQAFGNGGYYIKPWTIREYHDDTGKAVKNPTERKRVIKKETAFLTSTSLERSTKIPKALIDTTNYTKSPFAAKTGTSNWDKNQNNIPEISPRDTWVAGYTSEYTMSSWGGYPPKYEKQGYYPGYGETYKGVGHNYSAEVWGSMMTKLATGKEKSYVDGYSKPLSIVKKGFYPNTETLTVGGKGKFYTGNEFGYFFDSNQPSGNSPNSGYNNNYDGNEDDNESETDKIKKEIDKYKNRLPGNKDKKPAEDDDGDDDTTPPPTNPGDGNGGGNNEEGGGSNGGNNGGSGSHASPSNVILPQSIRKYFFLQ